MSVPPRPVHSGTLLVTTVTYNRRRLFQVAANCELFLETLQHYRREGHYRLHEFVVMPEHVHLLLTPQKISLERAVGYIKGGFSHRLQSIAPVWQQGFTDRRARNREEFLNFRQYIQMNPVEGRPSEFADDYKWSSIWKGWQKRG
ncbi:MAG TPA: transposase [Alloacidobacterium sp.]|nr:transposase [Alloacidobacterium sp.]